jgi:hypothetical protein
MTCMRLYVVVFRYPGRGVLVCFVFADPTDIVVYSALAGGLAEQVGSILIPLYTYTYTYTYFIIVAETRRSIMIRVLDYSIRPKRKLRRPEAENKLIVQDPRTRLHRPAKSFRFTPFLHIVQNSCLPFVPGSTGTCT